jgi:hypothetical protein
MDERVFLYHAHGFALGGRITQPVEQEINSHAATSLSVVGGFASIKAENYRLKDLISYSSAHTYISGIENENGIHSTVVDTAVEGLNILDMITADKVVGRISSKHEDGKPVEIITLGSTFENLRIAGKLVEVELFDHLFASHPTHDGLLAHFLGKCKTDEQCGGVEGSGKMRYVWGHPAGEMPHTLKKHLLVPPETGFRQSGHRLYTSLVKHVWETSPSAVAKQVVPYGHAIEIPQVGRLYLGELSSSDDTKQLTMMRIELGSPVVGRIAVAGPTGNGKWFP